MSVFGKGGKGVKDYGDRGVDPKLLELIVCPITKDTLVYDKENNLLISEKVGLAFSIKDGVPIMLVEKAIQVE